MKTYLALAAGFIATAGLSGYAGYRYASSNEFPKGFVIGCAVGSTVLFQQLTGTQVDPAEGVETCQRIYQRASRD